jgi:hypothetical protein
MVTVAPFDVDCAGSGSSIRRKGYASPQVTRLVNRIRELVAELRCLELTADPRTEARKRQIARLQERLAKVVRRELGAAQAVSGH